MDGCIYLRKSRADEKSDSKNNLNTLLKHKETLLQYAQEHNLIVKKIYEEVVSGDKLSSRPKMKEMLSDIKKNLYDFVLVMDIDRLGRGNMQEQGLILNTFKITNTVIITPLKKYDLNNEFDEEYSEFEAFMARKELKLISRRMQRGRIKSISDGNYIFTYPPFGYNIKSDSKNRFLIPDDDTCEIVKFIFEEYISGLGGKKISEKLNLLNVKTSFGFDFTSNSVLNIIKNPIYCGYITWNGEKEKLKVKADHLPLISEEIFEKANLILKNKKHPPSKKEIKNPFAGLIFCGYCNKTLKLRPYINNPPYLLCTNSNCKKCRGAKLFDVENEVINAIDSVFDNITFSTKHVRGNDTEKILNINLTNLYKQKEKIYDFFENNIYTNQEFSQRLNNVSDKIDSLETSKLLFENRKSPNSIKFNTFSKAYYYIDDISIKNQILKTFIDKIIYFKSKDNPKSDFYLEIYLRI